MKFASPAWSMKIAQVPALSPVTVSPATEHTAAFDDVKTGVKPLDAVAVITWVCAEPAATVNVNPVLGVLVIVWSPLSTVKFFVTCVAALYVAFPAWSPAIVQVPAATGVILPALTVQTAGVVLDKVTARPEDEVAVGVAAAPPTFMLMAKSPIVTFWLAFDTAKVCDTAGAAAKAPLPAWLASIVQLPAPSNVTFAPVTVQILVVAELKVTAKLEEAVAVRATGVSVINFAPGFANVMVWAARVPFTVTVTGVAAAYVALPF